MPAQILDGRALAQDVRRQVAKETAAFSAQTGVVPGLTVVLVGDDRPARSTSVTKSPRARRPA